MDKFIKFCELEEKIKQLETKCENVFNQLTDLRTVIQSLYGETSRSERFLSHEILKMSQRVEQIAKQVRPENTTINISPQISQNPNSESSSSKVIDPPITTTASDKPQKSMFDFDLQNMMTVGISAIIGLIILVGLVATFLIKLFSIFNDMFN